MLTLHFKNVFYVYETTERMSEYNFHLIITNNKKYDKCAI